MSEIDELRATVDVLAARVRALADQVEIMQLVAQYGPAVDSGSGEAAAALWTEDGSFDAVPHLRMRGRTTSPRWSVARATRASSPTAAATS